VRGRYRAPKLPGYATMRADAIAKFEFPNGSLWRERLARKA